MPEPSSRFQHLTPHLACFRSRVATAKLPDGIHTIFGTDFWNHVTWLGGAGTSVLCIFHPQAWCVDGQELQRATETDSFPQLLGLIKNGGGVSYNVTGMHTMAFWT
jgi:hypothetical protein